MKTTVLLAMLVASNAVLASAAPDSTGLPGDHFSLAGALDLFKRSSDLGSFERAINDEANHVNNLDLDSDGKVDYVRVESRSNGNAFAIVMQVPVSKDEAQDVAVIELEKTGTAQATVQIRGDELLYGPEVFLEPGEEGATKGARGPSAPEEEEHLYVCMNVWTWPCVQWCFSPYYSAWCSPWYWGFYPRWWNPWSCLGWGYWYHHCAYYDNWYYRTDVCRTASAHGVYMGHRRSSARVTDHVAAKRPLPAVQQRTNPTMNRGGRVQPSKSPVPDRQVKPMERNRGNGVGTKPGRNVAPGHGAPPPSRGGRPQPAPSKGGGGMQRTRR